MNDPVVLLSLWHIFSNTPFSDCLLFVLFCCSPLLSGSNFRCVVQHSETYCCFVCVSVCRTQRNLLLFCLCQCVQNTANLLLFCLCQCVQNTAKPTAVLSVCVSVCRTQPNLLLFCLSVSVCAEHSQTYCCFVCLCQCVQICTISFFHSHVCLKRVLYVCMYVHERNAVLILQQICVLVGISALILLSVRGYMRL